MVFRYTMLGIGVSFLIFWAIRTQARPAPRTMNAQYQEMTNEYLRVRHNHVDIEMPQASRAPPLNRLFSDSLYHRTKRLNLSAVYRPKVIRGREWCRASQGKAGYRATTTTNNQQGPRCIVYFMLLQASIPDITASTRTGNIAARDRSLNWLRALSLDRSFVQVHREGSCRNKHIFSIFTGWFQINKALNSSVPAVYQFAFRRPRIRFSRSRVATVLSNQNQNLILQELVFFFGVLSFLFQSSIQALPR